MTFALFKELKLRTLIYTICIRRLLGSGNSIFRLNAAAAPTRRTAPIADTRSKFVPEHKAPKMLADTFPKNKDRIPILESFLFMGLVYRIRALAGLPSSLVFRMAAAIGCTVGMGLNR